MKQFASEVTDAQRRTCKTCKNMYIYYTLDFTSSDEWKVSVQDVHIQQQYTDICLISTYPRNDSNIKKNRQVSFFFLSIFLVYRIRFFFLSICAHTNIRFLGYETQLFVLLTYTLPNLFLNTGHAFPCC